MDTPNPALSRWVVEYCVVANPPDRATYYWYASVINDAYTSNLTLAEAIRAAAYQFQRRMPPHRPYRLRNVDDNSTIPIEQSLR